MRTLPLLSEPDCLTSNPVFLCLLIPIFGNNFTTKSKHMLGSLNLYKVIFAALFILKIGDVGTYAEISWWLIILPLVIGLIHSYVKRLMDATGITAEAKGQILDMYVERKKRQMTKKAIQELHKSK